MLLKLFFKKSIGEKLEEMLLRITSDCLWDMDVCFQMSNSAKSENPVSISWAIMEF